MNSFFKELFDYTHHFNQEVIRLLLAHPDQAPEKALSLINHTVNAHQIWLSRILKEKPVGVYDMRPLQELAALDLSNYHKTEHVLDTLELSNTITYTNSKGETYSKIMRDILFHVVNHATYHRAQIVTACKQEGIKPLSSDYILFK